MDAVVHSALEEFCSQGSNGLRIRNLWPRLGPSLSSQGLSLCPEVKRALWVNLLDIPGLEFESEVAGPCNSKEELMKCSVEEWEKKNLKIVAPESLRNNFMGIYDIEASDSGISEQQKRALERLAIARTNGITQSELAKELGIKGNNIFYVLKKLETWGLIVRQSTIMRTKESTNEGELKNGSIVSTNMLHLYRYAKHLGSQQRLEIVKEDKPPVECDVADGDGAGGDGFGERTVKEVHVKDFLPALKAVCDKLEKAEGQVLVVSDIKKDLGYREDKGHKAWRNICHRLKDARVVEECCIIVNKKKVDCLRLLKKFSPSYFEPKSHGRGHDRVDVEQPINLGNRGQATEQLVELPILRQVYDIIDAEGSKGLTITEVCKRLGIRNKPYYNRLKHMFSTFGMHLEPESQNRGVGYRVWTAGNFNPEASLMVPGEPDMALLEGTESDQPAVDLNSHEKSAKSIQVVGASTSTSNDDNVGGELTNMEPESSSCSKVDAEGQNMLLCPINSKNSDTEPSNGVPVEELGVMSKELTNTAPLETCRSVSSPLKLRSKPRYLCHSMGAASSMREQRILQMLQEEKFLIRPDLHRRIESLEKEKNTMMDPKTLLRTLNKLQQDGHCKCIQLSVPSVTNCGRKRTTDVILHPSVYNESPELVAISPELVGKIHDRMRSFESQLRRSQSYSRQKGKPMPVLDSVHRISNSIKLDVQAERAEVMRSNGYVLAKMVRTKLLHIFLWEYVSRSVGWNSALLFNKHSNDLKNPHSTCKFLELDKAIKSMPLELFLQVVGSTKKFEDMLEKCRSGLQLSNLPVEECKRLMDTRATGRLSWLIDVLRRLKLIRLLSKGNEEDSASGSYTTLTHALELKPYIEEPVSTVVLSSDFLYPDLRPQVRHDFVLSTREAVDEYWNTLEYCYAAAKSQAALHAFPGSAVHEVFHSRSWVSVRVMTAEQRAELLKSLARYKSNRKLLYKECQEIAENLSLTMEQVLRVHYDNRQQRRTRLQGAPNAKVEDIHEIKRKRVLSSKKRKRNSERKSSEFVKANITDGQSSAERATTPSDSDDPLMEEEKTFSASEEDNDYHLQRSQSGDNVESRKEPQLDEVDEEARSFIHNCALSRLKPPRGRKFSWTDEADRQLVTEYARYRAARGADFHRVEWASISSLPAPPDTCRRRMTVLNRCDSFRKALMRLCSILAGRYARYLEQVQGELLNHADSVMMDHGDAFENENVCSSSCEFGTGWENFHDESIKRALDDVLQFKGLVKSEASKRMCSRQENKEGKYPGGTGFSPLAPCSQEVEYCEETKPRGQRSNSRMLPRKYVKLLNYGASVGRQAHESVAIANAAELFKLIFLSTSSAPEVPTLLAETLRRYSERDLFAAFNYLREKKIMIGGSCNSPFTLSHHFLQSISLSPFPVNTGKRAANFSRWLKERENDLMEEGVGLPADLQCGEIFHLCALVFSGELSITPFLPEEGVGEAKDTRTSKRKHEDSEIYVEEMPKKSRTSLAGEGEVISRREKGFPGIKLQLHRATIPRTHFIVLYKDEDEDFNFGRLGENTATNTSSLDVDCYVSQSDIADHAREIIGFKETMVPAYDASKSPWEAMKSYSEHMISSCSYQEKNSSLHPEAFKTLCSAIQKSGDQGLSMKQISGVLNMQGKILELMIEVLEAFGRAIKVNAYDNIRVVDSLYRSKYFLTPVAAARRDQAKTPLSDQKGKMDKELLSVDCNNQIDDDGDNNEINMNDNNGHTVTILNLPQDVADPPTEIQSKDKNADHQPSEVLCPKMDEGIEMQRLHYRDSQMCRPILPWMNGDGTVNELVYKSLVRRILGIVMQNPGILEDDIIYKMRALNPQSCRKLLEMMIMDNHIITRKIHQTTSGQPPVILSGLLGCRSKRPTSICREHFYANPMSTSLL